MLCQRRSRVEVRSYRDGCMAGRRGRACAAWFAGIVLSLAGTVAAAGTWTIDPRVDVEEIYTDNIGLAPSGAEDDEFITQVSPAIRIRGEGARLELNLDYVLQTLKFARGTSPFTKNQTLQADATAELVEKIFFIDGRATLREQNVNNAGRSASGNISQTDNKTTVTTMDLSPYVKHRFGNYADSEARISFNSVSTGGAISDSSSVESTFSVTSGSRFSRMPWEASYNNRIIHNQGGGDSKFKRLEGTVRYRVNRKFTAFYTAGVDSNEFSSSQESQDGTRWRAGGTWTPSPRTTVTAGWGSQFSGSNFSLDLEHHRRRSVITATFSQDVTTTRGRLLDQQLIPLEDAFGEPITDTTLDGQANAVSPLDTERLSDETLVVTRFDGGYAFQGRRTNVSVNIFNTQRDGQVSNSDTNVFGGNFSVSRRMSRRTTGRVSGSLQVSKRGGGVQTDTRLSSNVSLVRQFGRSVSGSLAYAYTRTDSDSSAGSEFQENRLTLGLQVTY